MRYGLFGEAYSTFIKAVIVAIFLISFAHGADFKVDLSDEINKEASSKIVDGAEKKKIALEFFKLRNSLDEVIESEKIITPTIDSTNYLNGVLTIKLRFNFDQMELERLFKIFGDFPKVDADRLIDLKSKMTEVNTLKNQEYISVGIKGDEKNKTLIPVVVQDRFFKLVHQKPYEITLTSESGEVIKSETYFLTNLSFNNNQFIIEYNTESVVSLKISSQEAAKIKSINVKSIASPDNTLTASLTKYQSIAKINQSQLILSSQSSEPVLAFETSREKLLLNFKDPVNMMTSLKNKKNIFSNRFEISFISELWYSKTAELIALQSLFENGKSKNSSAAVNDFLTIFSTENINNVGYGSYRAKYKSDIEIGCQKYISKDFKFDNPAKGFGFDGGNEVNSLMNQMGMANNSVVLGSPDQKIRVITGFISSLTENGGIISNGNTMKDANPIQFTKNAKTVIFNPEKVTVGKSLVRIVGTYDQNSKIKLTNGLGGTKIVDAANINVTCIEGMQSSDEMMQNMYKMLGIMK